MMLLLPCVVPVQGNTSPATSGEAPLPPARRGSHKHPVPLCSPYSGKAPAPMCRGTQCPNFTARAKPALDKSMQKAWLYSNLHICCCLMRKRRGAVEAAIEVPHHYTYSVNGYCLVKILELTPTRPPYLLNNSLAAVSAGWSMSLTPVLPPVCCPPLNAIVLSF